MAVQTVGLLGMATLLTLIFLRVPVGVAMGLVGFFGYAAIDGWTKALTVLGQAPYDVAGNYTLSVIPLFIVMGEIALRTGMSAKLYDAARSIFLGTRGSQAYATIGACAGFGAICGSSIATAAAMSRIAIPQMRRAGYDDRLSTGSVAAGGSLGILVPPSVPFVVYALTAQQSVPRLFAAGLLPTIVLTTLYMLVAFAITVVKPSWAPRQETQERRDRFRQIVSIWDIALLFGITIGGLYAGWFIPTQAAAIGATGALLLGVLNGKLTWRAARESFRAAIGTSCMLFVIVICAVIFSYFVVQTQLPTMIVTWAKAWNLGPVTLIFILIAFYIVLGCFMDGLGMILITVPVFLPLVVANGYDAVWFGVILVVVIELGLIHPPVGMNIFVIQGQAPEIPVLRIYQGIIPFLAAPFILLLLLVAAPSIALWLPNHLFQ
jgi:C4-dicarboxylate transporter DctM subunit